MDRRFFGAFNLAALAWGQAFVHGVVAPCSTTQGAAFGVWGCLAAAATALPAVGGLRAILRGRPRSFWWRWSAVACVSNFALLLAGLARDGSLVG